MGAITRNTESDPALEDSVPAWLRPFFETPHLLSGENASDWVSLVAAVAATLRPEDAVEWLFTKRICDVAWEQRRLQRLKPVLIESRRSEAFTALMGANAIGFSSFDAVLGAWGR